LKNKSVKEKIDICSWLENKGRACFVVASPCIPQENKGSFNRSDRCSISSTGDEKEKLVRTRSSPGLQGNNYFPSYSSGWSTRKEVKKQRQPVIIRPHVSVVEKEVRHKSLREKKTPFARSPSPRATGEP
jgi:hypothetical protein